MPIVTPKDMHEQNSLNKILATVAKGGIRVHNVAPAPDNSKPRRPTKAERKRRAKLRAKRNAIPMFSAELCVPPKGVLMAREAFALAAKAQNPNPSAPAIPLDVLEARRARLSDDVGSLDSSGATPPQLALSPEPAAPPTSPTKAARLAAAQRFRKLKAQALENARAAFDDSLRGARQETSNRLNNGISNAGAIRANAEKAIQEVEVKAVLAARRFLEDWSGVVVDLYSANLHRTALDNFVVAISTVHSDADAPVNFGDTVQNFSTCMERAYYGMLVRSKCKKVLVVGGGMDGNILDIKIAAMLSSYTLLLPAND